ncbi:hypothetical protein K438DRAFT_1942841 [Mycena galopus ATCC 62051]|nr:hypothetical protein K438DRAFT_1942841 [Mycena galopus ATCC 62051]
MPRPDRDEEGHVFVINLHIMAELPQELVRICENRDILKVAAGIFSDGQRLWDSFRMDIFSAISLSLVARLAYPTTLMTIIPLQSSQPWLRSLSGEQKNYAAIDAHASLRAFLTMRTLLDNCGYPVLPTWYTHDIFELVESSVGRMSTGLLTVRGGRRTIRKVFKL